MLEPSGSSCDPKVHQLAAWPHDVSTYMGNTSHSNHGRESVSEFPVHQMNLDVDGDSDMASVFVSILRFHIFRRPIFVRNTVS